MEMTKEEKKYWKGIITNKAIRDILEKRQEKTSCVHDLSRIFNPQGVLRKEIKQHVSEAISQLRKREEIIYVRRDKCDESKDNRYHVNHLIIRIRLPTDALPSKKHKTYKTYKAHGSATEKQEKILDYAKQNPQGFWLKDMMKTLTGTSRSHTSGYNNYHASFMKLKEKKMFETELKGRETFVKPVLTQETRTVQEILKPLSELGKTYTEERTEYKNLKSKIERLEWEKRMLNKIADSNMNIEDKMSLIKELNNK